MLRILQKCGYGGSQIFATSTGIFASAIAEDTEQVATMIRRVPRRSNDLAKVAAVNGLSRDFVEGKIDADEALRRLADLRRIPPYPAIVRILGCAVASFCFASMLGGGLFDSLAAFIAASIMQIPVLMLDRRRVAGVLVNIIGGFCGAMLSLILLNAGLGEDIGSITIGAIMPLVPGVSLTNAIRDILGGDFSAGSARIMEALLVAVAIAAGVGIAMHLWVSTIGGALI